VNTLSKSLVAVALLCGSMAANAGLTSVAGGLGVYDSTNNVTWTANGNLFAAQYSTTLVNTIIADASAANGGAGLIGLAGYTLSASDFNSNGTMTWYGANAWVNYLNVTKYAGSSKWTLPTTVDSSSASWGYPDGASGNPAQSSSQLAELFYEQWGGTPDENFLSTLNSSAALFSNLQSLSYWSGTQYGPIPSNAWYFETLFGNQFYGTLLGLNYVLAVAPGEIAPPAALLTALQNQVIGIAPEGLEDKATNALNHLQAACTSLTNFVSQVQAQNGKKIGQTLDAQLIAEAQTIETAIGCN
jgi:hypothetical protein